MTSRTDVILLGWYADENSARDKNDRKLGLAKILLLTIASMILMIPINIARIWGMISYPWRRMKW